MGLVLLACKRIIVQRMVCKGLTFNFSSKQFWRGFCLYGYIWLQLLGVCEGCLLKPRCMAPRWYLKRPKSKVVDHMIWLVDKVNWAQSCTPPAPWALVFHRLLMLVSGSDLLKFGFLLSGETLSLAGDLFYNISSTLLLLDVQRWFSLQKRVLYPGSEPLPKIWFHSLLGLGFFLGLGGLLYQYQ